MIWEWPGSMMHNTNAVLNPTETLYLATCKVYCGNETTGLPIRQLHTRKIFVSQSPRLYAGGT
ncbi:MAG: hypothetical protein GWN81_10000 [Phycisphaerae bacterium]|nr:hypothetical protein [Phycisphaerae bacterium]NIP52594.1 hypothetical protein [Phycisphaerae bacterium]NIS51578.1 hypothetical protein [Phycisphaerae bacterium]NIU09160.1 hypothetical protein [Phycisphaerae bacterium]NIW93271.1 hypothetical protein [Phycisphaerae bacterium]